MSPRRRLRDRLPEGAIAIRCTCGKLLGRAWLTTTAGVQDVDAVWLVPARFGETYRTRRGTTMRYLVSRHDEISISCTACASDPSVRTWTGSRSQLIALVERSPAGTSAYLTATPPAPKAEDHDDAVTDGDGFSSRDW